MFELNTWQEILFLILAVIVLLGGAPIIQLIKNLLSAIFKTQVKDKWAVFVAVVCSIGLAIIEMWLTGQFTTWHVTIETFPAYLGSVLGLAQVYFAWFKRDSTFFGASGLLKDWIPKE